MPYKRIPGLKTPPHCRHYPPGLTLLALAGRNRVCLRNGCFYLTARDERTSCAQWPWPQAGHRSRLPARGGLVGGVNPGCASGLGGGRPRGRARGPALRVNVCAFSHAKTSSVTRATRCGGDRKKYAPTVQTSSFRTVVLPVHVARANYSNGCFESASDGEEG